MEDLRSTDPYWRRWPSKLPEPPPEASVTRYHTAFAQHFSCLWNVEHHNRPTSADILGVARTLKNNGSLKDRAFADTLEAPIRAVLDDTAKWDRPTASGPALSVQEPKS